MSARFDRPPQSILIVMPTWLGDIAMATPTLKAIRSRWPQAHVRAIFKTSVMAQLAQSLPGIDEAMCWQSADHNKPDKKAAWRMQGQAFDVGVLLPNSLRSAWHLRQAKAKRRLGYARDGRSWLLTDRIQPVKDRRGFVPVPTVDYYLKLAAYLDADISDAKLDLVVPEESTCLVLEKMQAIGLTPGYVLLNPGAVRESKRWPAERFGLLAADIIKQTGRQVAVTGSPAEKPIIEKVCQAAKDAAAQMNLPADSADSPVTDLTQVGLVLGDLPAWIKQAGLLVTNDTGPRHVAAGVGTPIVSLFGPTPPEWTVLDFELEIQLVAGQINGPGSDTPPSSPSPQTLRASSKHAVKGHTMDLIPVDRVLAACVDLLNR